tara:strand:- start:66 stop:272 length:207 start_codon:yes stop_codon:yes gene_type:complete
MTTTRKDLLNDINHLKSLNTSLTFENKKLKEIIEHYGTFLNNTNKGKSFNAFQRIQDLSNKIGKKDVI